MTVCIAEKPAVAREIASVLGATAQHTGYYEGNGYQVTWTYGHLCTLKEPNDYQEMWKRWTLGMLPMIPQRFQIKLIEMDHIKKQYAIVEKLYQNADMIINCGDAGQEGELIQRWVMQKARVKCPVKRLWISSLTEEAIREGFNNLRDQKEFEPLYLAGLSRAIGDWLLGMNATRLYTIKYKDNNRQDKQPLSIGRVQTPTLAMIVNRQREIENFVPKQSWVLSTIYRNTKFNAIAHDEEAEAEDAAEVEKARKEGKTIKSKGDIYKPLEFLTKEEGEKVVEEIKDQPLRVISVTKKKGTEKPPQLFDLTTLQVECNKKFAYTAEQTLNLIQSLYEKKFTTYPRVDTQYLTDDIYKKCPQTLNGVYQVKFNGTAPYADLIRPLGGGKALRKDKKVFDNSKVTDHHAIIPTGVIPKGLSDAERNVYDLIARRFIAVFYDDCKFETTTVMAQVTPATPAASVTPAATTEAGEATATEQASMAPEAVSDILFRTSGKVITDEGWKVVFKKETQTQTENTEVENGEAATDNSGDEKLLPTFNKGEEGPHEPQLAEKWTSPPPYYTEATLLRAMETAGKFVDNDELRAAMKENGIGRPSSRANIIETLFKRQYIKRERKRIVATPTGKALIDVIHEELLKSPELTGIWEKKLRDIEARKYDAATFINELKQQITDIVNQVLSDNSNRKLL